MITVAAADLPIVRADVKLKLRASVERWALVREAVRTINRLAAACAYLDKGTSGLTAAADVERELQELLRQLYAEGTRLTIELALQYVQSTPPQDNKWMDDYEPRVERQERPRFVDDGMSAKTRRRTQTVTRDDLFRLYAIHGSIRKMAVAMGVLDVSVYRLLRKFNVSVQELREYRP